MFWYELIVRESRAAGRIDLKERDNSGVLPGVGEGQDRYDSADLPWLYCPFRAFKETRGSSLPGTIVNIFLRPRWPHDPPRSASITRVVKIRYFNVKSYSSRDPIAPNLALTFSEKNILELRCSL